MTNNVNVINAFIVIAVACGFIILIQIIHQIRDAYPPKWRRNRWDEKQRHTLLQPAVKWQSWFAWRPVKTVSGQIVWWQQIYRTVGNDYVDQEDWSWYHYGTIFDVIRDFK